MGVVLICLTFDTQAKAETALAIINENYNLPIPSHNAQTGEVNPDAPAAVTWCAVRKAYEQNLWYIEKPPEDKMTGVTDYMEQEFSDSWTDPQYLYQMKGAE